MTQARRASINDYDSLCNTWTGDCLKRKIISIYAEKGGVGKTTTSTTFAFQLAEMGKRVLIYDCDPQRSCSALFIHPQMDYNHPFPYDHYIADPNQRNWLGNAHYPKTLHDQMEPIRLDGGNVLPLPAQVIYLMGNAPENAPNNSYQNVPLFIRVMHLLVEPMNTMLTS